MRRLLHTCFLVFLLLPVASAQTAQQDPLVIKGQVLDDQERPVSGAYVIASPDGGLRGRVPSASSDSRGEFRIVVYKSDSFKVTASKPADGYPSSANPFYYPTEDSLAHVWVLEGQAAPFATVRLGPKAGNLAGRVVDAETGRSIEDFQITLCRAEAPRYCHRQPSKSSGGRFNILVPAAPFTVQISASGYEDWYGAERGDQQPVSVQVNPGTTKELDISLARSSARGDDAKPALLGSPQPLLPANGAEFTHYPRTTRLEWSAVAGAASYTVELEVCQSVETDGKECQGQLLQIRGNPPLSGIEGTSYEFLFIGAQPGRWRVWAVDAKGRVGLKSTWSKFVYKQ
jgi:hypothetical protein